MYEFYIGDGDSKTLPKLKESKPYGNRVIVKKNEHVLHVEKRLYRSGKLAREGLARLKKLKMQQKKNQRRKTSSKSTNWKKKEHSKKKLQLSKR